MPTPRGRTGGTPTPAAITLSAGSSATLRSSPCRSRAISCAVLDLSAVALRVYIEISWIRPVGITCRRPAHHANRDAALPGRRHYRAARRSPTLRSSTLAARPADASLPSKRLGLAGPR